MSDIVLHIGWKPNGLYLGFPMPDASMILGDRSAPADKMTSFACTVPDKSSEVTYSTPLAIKRPQVEAVLLSPAHRIRVTVP